MTLLTGWKVQNWKTSFIDFFFQKPKSFLKIIKLPVFIIIIIIMIIIIIIIIIMIIIIIIIIIIKDFTVIINKG